MIQERVNDRNRIGPTCRIGGNVFAAAAWRKSKSWLLAAGLLAAIAAGSAGAVIVPQDYVVEVYADQLVQPKDLDFDSQGTLYVAQDEGSGIYRIASGGASIVSRALGVTDPDCLAVDANDQVYLGSESQGLYRMATNGSLAQVTTSYMGNNHGICIDHAGIFGTRGVVYVANARASTDLVAVNPEGAPNPFVVGSVLAVVPGLAFDDGQFLYAAEFEGGMIYRIDRNATVSAFVSFAGPYCLAFHQPTRTFYVSDITEEKIYRLTLDGIKTTFAEGISARGLRFGPDGALYVSDWSTSPGRVLRMRRSPRIELRLAHDEALQWPSTPGLLYQVRHTTNLFSAAWANLGGPILATQSNTACPVSFSDAPQRFFRVLMIDSPPF